MNIISKSGSLPRWLGPFAALLFIGMAASGCMSLDLSGGSSGGSSGGGSSGGGSSGGGSTD